MFFYNTIAGGVISGVGAMINHKKEQKLSKAFIRGFSRGCIGGAVNYGGKLTSQLMVTKSTINYAIPAKIIHSFGTSIVENAALNKKFIETYHLNISFVRIEFTKKISLKIMPGAIVGLAIVGFNGSFQPKKSLQTFTPYFKGNMAFTITNSFVIAEEKLKALKRSVTDVVAHELIHTMQWDEYLIINTWTKKVNNKVKTPNIIYWDIPYFTGTYLAEEFLRNRNKNSLYNSNFFEYEAHSFQTMQFQKRHR